MYEHGILYYIVMFIVSVVITWIALSLLLMWAKPALYNSDGSINWWTTLWVSAVLIIFVWIILLLLWFIIKLFSCKPACNTYKPECPQPKQVECPPPKPECPPPKPECPVECPKTQNVWSF